MIRPFPKRDTNPFPRPRLWRGRSRPPVTVCIAAVCEQGRVIVTATDGAISYDGQRFDIHLAKMMWLGDWLFLYAGQVGNWELMMQDMALLSQKDPACLSHERIADTVHRAFERRLAAWASDPLLMPLGTNIQELREKGVAMFGEGNVKKLMSRIIEAAHEYNDSVLLIGWGDNPLNFVLHEENRDGSTSHAPSGFAAIGSGAPVALSQLHILGQARHSTLEETLYRVAAAKFAAEHVEGVGESTVIHIAWKKMDQDADSRLGRFVRTREKDALREIWEEWGKPKLPGSLPAGQPRTTFSSLSAILKISDLPRHIFDPDCELKRHFQLVKDSLQANEKKKD